MTGFQLATILSDDGPRAALVVGNVVHDLSSLSEDSAYGSVLSILGDWARTEPALHDMAASLAGRTGPAIEDVHLLAPILSPPAVYCAGANYAEHVTNMERRLGLPAAPDPRANGGRPFHFLKASRCCVGDGASVKAPSPNLDWEGELVAVIGREARNIAAKDALGYVAGYMVGNDLSARDVAFRPQSPPPSPFNHSWLDHKSFEGAAPIGPWIVPASQIPDPAALRIVTRVNGTVRQDASTGGMTFSLQEQLAYISSVITLVPGDIVMTGTPAGTGAESGEFLAPGDRVTVEIEGIGVLATSIV